MGRKVFQNFAHVLCQKLVLAPRGRDILQLAIMGHGKLVMDLVSHRAGHNRYPVSRLPYMEDARLWLQGRLWHHSIPNEQLQSAEVIVDYRVVLGRSHGDNHLTGAFAFACLGRIGAPDRVYESTLTAEREWGLSVL